MTAELRARIAAELAHGRAVPASNPGQARVCARRAAGWAVRAWYQQREGPNWTGDALKQLHRLRADPAVPEALRAAAERLGAKVDHEHHLPFDNPPLDDADLIIAWVLPEPDERRLLK